jgi:hypothetical protein
MSSLGTLVLLASHASYASMRPTSSAGSPPSGICRAQASRGRRLDQLLADIRDDVLAPLTRPEREQLTDFLTRLLDHLSLKDKGDPPGAPPLT